MTIFGIIFFILMAIGLLIWISYEDDFFGGVFGSFVLTIIIILIFSSLGSINTKFEKSNKFGVTYIASVSAKNGVYGNFCLGSGTVESKTYYYYMIRNEFGYKICKIENDGDTYVKEDCDTKPYIEYSKYNASHINWFGGLFFEKQYYNKDGEVIIHVPKNTIVKNYNVDISKL